MEFGESAADREFRIEVRQFLAEHVTGEVRERMRRTGTLHDADFARAIAAKGWLSAAWPARFGGREAPPPNLAILYEEAARVGAPMNGVLGTQLVAETVRSWGSEALCDAVLPAAARGELVVALGFTEPDNGSDVAAAKTRARRADGGWVINGQKMFTTLAEIADLVFVLARTDSEAPKHRGLTLFLVRADTPGVEVRRLASLGGETTNVTYYTDVFVGDDWVVGEVNRGWDVLSTALLFERGAQGSFPAEAASVLDAHLTWARERHGLGLPSPLDSAVSRHRLVTAMIEVEVARLLSQRAVFLTRLGRPPAVEGSMAKLFATETYQRMCRMLMEVSGPAALLPHGDSESVADGAVEHAFRHCVVETIAGGTSEIQREIISRHGLRLPRAATA